VNQYPGRRDFKAIGSGGDDFKQTIVRAVENVLGPVKEDRVLQRPSSQGKFVSITLKDVKVQNPDQVRRHLSKSKANTTSLAHWLCLFASSMLHSDTATYMMMYA